MNSTADILKKIIDMIIVQQASKIISPRVGPKIIKKKSKTKNQSRPVKFFQREN
jgi:hypothetical protein